MKAQTNQVMMLKDILQGGLPSQAFDYLYSRHKSVFDSQLRWVTITTQTGTPRMFWVYQGSFVTCGLSTLSSMIVYPNLRRFVREFNLMFHPDKYRGPAIDGLQDLLSMVNYDPCVDSINDLLNILAMPINARTVASHNDYNLYNIRLCDNLSDMFRFCNQRTVGLSFFHLPLIKELTKAEFDRHIAIVLNGSETHIKKLCEAIFRDFKPLHCPKLKWVARGTKNPQVSTSVTCLLRLIRAIHRTMAVTDDWVRFVNDSLQESTSNAASANALVSMVGNEADSDSDRPPVTPVSPDVPRYQTLRPAKIVVPQPTPELKIPTTPTHKAILKRQLTPRTPQVPLPAQLAPLMVTPPPTKRVTRSMAAPRRSKRVRR
jgi:hypothetical protein